LKSAPIAPLTLAAIALIAASAPNADAQASAPAAKLSNETTSTRSANAAITATVYSRPSRNVHRVGRLRLLTEDGYPEVYLLLESRQDARGATWIKLRLPQRPNNVTGWVRRGALGPFHLVHTRLIVSRALLRVTLYDRGKRRFHARVGMGAPGTPTPTGSFWIREKFHVRGNPMYGPRAMGTAAYSNVLTDWPGGGVIGLHGTDQPGLIPGRPSHGCIRLHNRDIKRLYALTPIGTPVSIR
jgi:hypothetical protein